MPLRGRFFFASFLCVVGCGGRSDLITSVPRDAGVTDATPPVDAVPPRESSPDIDSAPPLPTCNREPAAGTTLVNVEGSFDELNVAVAGGSVYLGTTAVVAGTARLEGAIDRFASGAASTLEALTAPGYNFGAFASDGPTLYYPASLGMFQTNASMYSLTGLVALNVAAGTTQTLPASLPPYSLPSPSFGNPVVVAQANPPAVFWLVGSGTVDGDSFGATALLTWSPAAGRVSTLATGTTLVGLAIDATQIYWADTGDWTGAGPKAITIYAAPLGGGPATVLATEPWSMRAGGLVGVTSSEVVFVSDFGAGTAYAVPKSGGTAQPVLTAPLAQIAVDGENVYYTDSGTPGTVVVKPVIAGSATYFWSSPNQTDAVAALTFDACNAYLAVGPSPARVVAVGKPE